MGHGYVFPRGQLMPEERLMFLIALVVVGSVGGAFALATIHAEAASSRWRALWEGLPERLRRGGWGWLLVPVAVMYALLAGSIHQLIIVELLAGVLTPIFAPRLAVKAVAYALLILGGYGLVLAKYYHDGNTSRSSTGSSSRAPTPGARTWCWPRPRCSSRPACGCWCGWRRPEPGGSGRWSPAGAAAPAAGSCPPRAGCCRVAVLAMELLSARDWFGAQWTSFPRAVTADAAVATLSLVLVFRSRVWAATLAEAGLLVLGVYGLLITAFWPAVPGFFYGVADLAESRAVVGGACRAPPCSPWACGWRLA